VPFSIPIQNNAPRLFSFCPQLSGFCHKIQLSKVNTRYNDSNVIIQLLNIG
jgi:hypothetical protein